MKELELFSRVKCSLGEACGFVRTILSKETRGHREGGTQMRRPFLLVERERIYHTINILCQSNKVRVLLGQLSQRIMTGVGFCLERHMSPVTVKQPASIISINNFLFQILINKILHKN